MAEREPRPRRLPLFRIGLTLMIGAVAYSLMKFYISLPGLLEGPEKSAPPTESRDLAAYFAREFLFSGTVPGVLFWGGVALMLVRIVRGWGMRRSRT